jgi:uncharacterized membrane protein YgcG
MEQTQNKGIMAGLPCDIIGNENSREIEGGGKEGNILTENAGVKLDAKLKKAFKSSFKTTNAGFIGWFVLVLIAFAFLVLWKTTGVRWTSFVGATSFCLAIPSIALGFVAQTWNQIVRIIARVKGKDKDFFKQEEEDCSLSEAAAACFSFMKHVFRQNRKEAKRGYSRCEVKYTRNQHVRNNARSYRRAPRPVFAYSSGDDGGGGGSGSGDSDSSGDDSPKPSRHTVRLKSSLIFYKKPYNFSHLWRLLRAPGCCCLPRSKRSFWRWPV